MVCNDNVDLNCKQDMEYAWMSWNDDDIDRCL